MCQLIIIQCTSHCKHYKEENYQALDDVDLLFDKQIIKSKPEIRVIDKKKIKQCYSCKSKTEREWLIVTYHNNNEYIKNKLSTYRCARCNSLYIADTLFKTYTQNKNIESIDVKFIQE